VGLDLKRPRGPWLALIVVGALVLVAAIVGVVALAAGGGDDGSASSSKLDTSFTEPAHFDSIDAVYGKESFSCGATDSRCIEKYMIKVTDDYGPRASLGVLERLQQEQKVNMSVNDHQMAHVVGRDTAKDYGSNFKAFDLCPTTFNYGCSHGFFEYVLARTPDARKAATTICESLNPETNLLIAGFTCYHGVGHGIMMAQGYNVQNSLKECNTMPAAKDKDGCWQGVFMENVNAGMQGRALPGYFKKSDPLSPCDKVGNRYKHECFINHAGWLMTVAKDNMSDGSRYCLKAKPAKYKSSCWQSLGLMVTNPVWQATLAKDIVGDSPAKIAAVLCERFPEVGRKDCVVAGVDNLANFDQFKVSRENAFCQEVSAKLQKDCYSRIGLDIAARTQDQVLIRKSCAPLGDKARYCLQGANITA
jgi:hypothetical protein